MTTFSQPIFSNTFSGRETFELDKKNSLKFVPKVQLTIGEDSGSAPNRRQAIIRTNSCIGYRRIYASLGLINLKKISMTFVIVILPANDLEYFCRSLTLPGEISSTWYGQYVCVKR